MEKRSPPCYSPAGWQHSPFLPLPHVHLLSNTFPPHFQGSAPLVFTAGCMQSLPILSVRWRVAQDIGVVCLMVFICCSLLPSESSSRLPSVATPVWAAFLCHQPCPQHCLPPHCPNVPLHISPCMFSPCFLCISSPVSKHFFSLNFSPNGCHSRLNTFEWRCHVLLRLEF